MFSRRSINVVVIIILGFGIPAYYKTKALLLGTLTFAQIFDPLSLLFVDIAFGFGLATMAILAHDWVVHHLRKRFPKRTDHIKRFVIQFTCSTVFSIAVLYLFTIFFFTYISQYTPPDDFVLDLFMMGLFIPILVNGVKESLYYYGEWENELLRKEQLQKENIQAQYEVLKNQINPHFLFNCFNTLTELAHEDKALTIKFIQQLAQVYRFVLEHKNQQMVDLKQELGVLDSYIFLLKIRFGDNLHINTQQAITVSDYSIVPLTLQILLENALKHNVVSKDKPLSINIDLSEDNKLVFRNNLQRKSSVQSTHIGLQNIINRYRMIADQTIDIVETATEFIVKVPLIHVEMA